MSKHTPGPWVRSAHGITVYALNELGVNRFWAQVQDAHTPREELEANACLMAASPDLFDACVEFVRKVECGEAKSTRSYTQMKAAISKATGEAS